MVQETSGILASRGKHVGRIRASSLKTWFLRTGEWRTQATEQRLSTRRCRCFPALDIEGYFFLKISQHPWADARLIMACAKTRLVSDSARRPDEADAAAHLATVVASGSSVNVRGSTWLTGCGLSHCQRQQAVGPTLSQPADSQGATPGFANCSHPAVCNTVAGPGANFMHPGHAERPVFPTLQERGWTVLLDPVWPSRFGVCSGDLDRRGSRQR